MDESYNLSVPATGSPIYAQIEVSDKKNICSANCTVNMKGWQNMTSDADTLTADILPLRIHGK